MMNRYKMLFGVLLLTGAASCKMNRGPVPPYNISKIFSTDTLTTVNAHIQSRLNDAELVAIAGKIKADSNKLKNLEVHFLLPGNTDINAGEHSYYAQSRFIKESDVKPTDTLKDAGGNVLRLRIWGLSKAKAGKLLAISPKETKGKQIIGKYIDDYSHTVIIPFKDADPAKQELYIIEADSSQKIVSATIAIKIKDTGTQKWQVTQNGDYITLKDSVLSQFAADGLGLPFNSIKSGI